MPMSPKTQQGLTLVELMVAITLSLIILAGVIQLFISSKETYRINDMISQIQESGRFAVESISRDLRMTGYQGCADPGGVDATTIVLNSPPTASFRTTALGGVEGGAAADSFSVQYAASEGVPLVLESDPINGRLTIATNSAMFTAGEVIMVSDCNSSHLLRITGVADVSGNVEISYDDTENDMTLFTKSYPRSSTRLMRFNTVTYTVADTGRKNDAGLVIPGLFRQELGGAAQELVESVENMQIEFAERLSGGNLRYVSADEATLNMANVVSVRVGLLLQTTELTGSRSDNLSYMLASTNVQPVGTTGATVTHAVDKRFRRVFNTTVYLRNRE